MAVGAIAQLGINHAIATAASCSVGVGALPLLGGAILGAIAGSIIRENFPPKTQRYRTRTKASLRVTPLTSPPSGRGTREGNVAINIPVYLY